MKEELNEKNNKIKHNKQKSVELKVFKNGPDESKNSLFEGVKKNFREE